MNKKEVIISGLNKTLDKLTKYENLLNSINVFPIADEDTGTNLKSTFNNICANLDNNLSSDSLVASTCDYFFKFSRGNSGALLSMFFSCFKTINENYNSDDFIKSIILGADNVFLNFKNPINGGITSMFSIIKEESLKMNNNTISIGEALDMLTDKIENNLSIIAKNNEVLLNSNYVDSGSLALLMILDSFNEIINNKNERDYEKLIYINNIKEYHNNLSLSIHFYKKFRIEIFLKEVERYGKINTYYLKDYDFEINMESNEIDTLLFMFSLYGKILSYKIINHEIDNLISKNIDIFYCIDDFISAGLKSMEYQYVFSKNNNETLYLMDTISELLNNNLNITLWTSINIDKEIENKIPRIRYFENDEALLNFVISH